MDTEENMTIDERRRYLRLTQKRYKRATRKGKARLLDEMEAMTGLHRKALIRLMMSDLQRAPRRKQRGRKYGVQVQIALMVISESTDYVCAERLQPNLVWFTKHLARHGELEISPGLLDQLGEISIPTVRRILQRLEQDQPRLPRTSPREANRVARPVPIRRIPWDEQEPGHLEVALVHHCCPTADGHYIHRLQIIDIATGLSRRVAPRGRREPALR